MSDEMKKTLTLLIILILGVIFFFAPINRVVSFEEIRTDNPQLIYINAPGENIFSIRFTHSIHLTDVVETYEITDSNHIRSLSMEYKDAGIGMPAHAEEGQTMSYENGIYKLQYKNKVLDNFALYIGDIDTDLRLIYEGKSYNIKQTLSRGSSYLFEIKNVSNFEKLKGVAMAHEN